MTITRNSAWMADSAVENGAPEDMHQHIYSRQLIESLSDVVDTLNEASADGFIYNFELARSPEGKYALVSLDCTIPVLPKVNADAAA
jgi:hypothetical protein